MARPAEGAKDADDNIFENKAANPDEVRTNSREKK